MQNQPDLAILQANPNQEQLRLALEIAQIGIWDWNLLTDCVTWSEQTKQLFGLNSDDTSSDALYWSRSQC
ncbi:MAG: hypothetical protein KME35_01485 [Aphanocapsa sp. GSE-SYN-MK-11-07L]|jgi:PAS domain-containing protein|nr:hypothetical protein [Aphanocapsa sp. GSE-SYN-MK-11-07L]